MAQLAFTPLDKLIHLLQAAPMRESTYVSVLGPGLLGVGTDPLRPTHTIDIAREALTHHTNDGAPMELEPSSIQKTETSTTDGSCASQSPGSTPPQKHPKASNDPHPEKKPQGNGASSSLMGRLETAAPRKQA